MSFLQRKKKPPLADATRMGFRDKLVLCKLGFDLRDHYEHLVNEPLPDALDQSIKSLEAAALDAFSECDHRAKRAAAQNGMKARARAQELA